MYVCYSVLLSKAGSCSVINHAQSALSSHQHFIVIPLLYLSSIESPLLLPHPHPHPIIQYTHLNSQRTSPPPSPQVPPYPAPPQVSMNSLATRTRTSPAQATTSRAGVPAVASFEYAAWHLAAFSSRSIFVAPVPASASAANTFDSLNNPASWAGDLQLVQSLCARAVDAARRR